MTRCKVCLYPDTKPDLAFVDGICAACRNYANRPEVDWDARKRELVNILSDAKPNGSGFDCIVPSSGGKDSTYQVITLIELGARPLVVTASTDFLTPLGRRNIDNLARHATTIEVTPNRTVRGKLCRLGLELVGDCCWPEHASIFSVPFRVARDLGIELIFYGENPQREYGGPIGAEQAAGMSRRWVTEFGGFLGLRPQDFIGHYGIRTADMMDYEPPHPDVWGDVSAYFLGQFIPWDSHRNARIANEAGMTQKLPTLANWWAFENIDNALTGLHDHGMYRKYGYGRFVGQVSVDIRNGLIDRETALTIAKANDGAFPFTYAGVTIDEVLEFLGMTSQELMAALDAHTNWDLFDGMVNFRPVLKEWADA
jgi:N-acetyl sugar amidotransferase